MIHAERDKVDRLWDYANMSEMYGFVHKGDYMQYKSPLVTLKMTVGHKLGNWEFKA
jgi:hypothetical protein